MVMCIIMGMNIYITPQNQERLRSLQGSMSGLINSLVDNAFTEKEVQWSYVDPSGFSVSALFHPSGNTPSPKKIETPKPTGISGSQYDSYEKVEPIETSKLEAMGKGKLLGIDAKDSPNPIYQMEHGSIHHIDVTRVPQDILEDIRSLELERTEKLDLCQDAEEGAKIHREYQIRIDALWVEYHAAKAEIK